MGCLYRYEHTARNITTIVPVACPCCWWGSELGTEAWPGRFGCDAKGERMRGEMLRVRCWLRSWVRY